MVMMMVMMMMMMMMMSIFTEHDPINLNAQCVESDYFLKKTK